MTSPGVRVGLTLPSFVRDVGELLAVATAAEVAGLDGVFVYDHLFRLAAGGGRRPALESTPMMAAVAAETSRIQVGVLVERATLRPPAVTALILATVNKLSGGFVGGIGAGDSESREENESFGLEFGTFEDRLDALRDTLRASRDQGFPVWAGGRHPAVREIAAAEADGWNRWGGDAALFMEETAPVYAAAQRPDFECSWGGLVVMDTSDEAAREKATRLEAGPRTIVGGPHTVADALTEYRDGGAKWVIAGPVNSRDPANAALLADVASRIE